MQRLLDEPFRFQLLQAVSILRNWLRQHGIPAESSGDFPIKFENSTSLRYPPSEIESIVVRASTPIDNVTQLHVSAATHQLNEITLTPACTGYLGVAGVLPNYFTELVAQHDRDGRDDGTRAFFDIFASRTVALLLEACTKYRVEHMRDADGSDAFLARLLSLGGVPEASAHSAQATGVDAETLAYYASAFRQRTVNSDTLASLLSEYFGVAITVTPFAPSYDAYSAHEQTALGVQNTVLGQGAMLGAGRWVRDRRVNIRIGPVKKADYARFRPEQPAALALQLFLSLFAVAPMQFHIQVKLAPEDALPVRLGAPVPGQLGLGLDSVLGSLGQHTEEVICSYTIDLPVGETSAAPSAPEMGGRSA